MTTAAVLYPSAAAWQSPRLMTQPDPVEAVPTPPATKQRLLGLESWVKPLATIAGFLIVIVGGPIYLDRRFTTIEKSVSDLDKKVDTIASATNTKVDAQVKAVDDKFDRFGKWLKDPTQFPGGPTAVPLSSSAPMLAQSGAPSPSVSAPDPSVSTKGLKGFPSNVPPTSPPECVSSKVFRKMPCEQAVSGTCQGLAGFAPDRYRQIRLQAGVGEYMLVCDEKAP